MESTFITLGLFVLGLIFSVIGWLLSNKDKKQAEEIKSLELEIVNLKLEHHNLQLHIAADHYKATTIDQKFNHIEMSIKEAFREVRDELKEIVRTKGQ